MKSLWMKKECSKFCFNFNLKLNIMPSRTMWYYVAEGIIKVYGRATKVPAASQLVYQ